MAFPENHEDGVDSVAPTLSEPYEEETPDKILYFPTGVDVPSGTVPEGRIVGGQIATNRSQFAYQVNNWSWSFKTKLNNFSGVFKIGKLAFLRGNNYRFYPLGNSSTLRDQW